MISKIKDVMNSNRQFTYKIWLDELNTTPLHDFITIARQFFELLKKENTYKIERLIDIFDDKSKLLVNYANKAVEELEPLLNQIEIELKQIGVTELPSKIREYEDSKAGRVRLVGEDLPVTLYHAIRLTLEEYRNKGFLTKFDSFITLHEEHLYLDYEKLCKQYSSYKEFREYKDHFELERKEEPWGAYIYLSWATGFFKHYALESTDSYVKSDMISSFKRLILYLLTPEQQTVRKLPVKLIGIKGLFSLSENPVAIYYEGLDKAKRGWIYPKGKVQPYAILRLASEKYKRQQSKGGNHQRIKLSYIEIEEYLTNPKYCDRQPNWKGIISSKRRLNHLQKNIQRLIPFIGNELKVEEYNQTAFLIFNLNPA